MAGRCINVTKSGLGPVRVIKTCAVMGEVEGKAAAVCVKKSASPRQVYTDHLKALQSLLSKPGSDRS